MSTQAQSHPWESRAKDTYFLSRAIRLKRQLWQLLEDSTDDDDRRVILTELHLDYAMEVVGLPRYWSDGCDDETDSLQYLLDLGT
jgi:hypothetical protein